MKTINVMAMLVMVAMFASAGTTELVLNPDFDDGDANWSYSSAWGNYFYTAGSDTITSMGGWGNNVDWSNTSLWQDTGATFKPNSVYTLECTWRDAPGETPVDNIRLKLQDVTAGWLVVTGQVFTVHNGTNWHTSSLVIDTASYESVVGNTIGVGADLTSGTGTWIHMDRISLVEVNTNALFDSIVGTPTDPVASSSAWLEATIVDGVETFSSAILYLNDNPVATNDTPVGATNVVNYSATGLIAGTNGCRVDVYSVESASEIAQSYSWSFEVIPFEITSTTPTGWFTNGNVALEVVISDGASIVSNTTTLYIDDVDTGAVIDRSLAPTSTIAYAASGLSHGIHTGRVVVVGHPAGLETAEWTFSVVLEDSISTNLVHHWDFEEGSGTNVADLVGGSAWNGSIFGTNHAWVSGGLDLLGGLSSGDWDPTSTNTSGRGSYVDLPNGLASSLPNAVTFEMTYSVASTWPNLYLWSFGTSGGGEGVADYGTSACALSTSGGGGYSRIFLWDGTNPDHVSMSDNKTASERIDTLTHLVWVFDADGTMSKLYVNGELVNAQIAGNWPLSNMLDVNNWLGRSQWGGDGMWAGKLYDFRIYGGIMTESVVADRYNALVLSESPYITSISVNGADVVLSWTAQDAGAYSILRKTSLGALNWSTVVSNLPSGDLTTNVTASGADQEFYMIKGE